MVVACKDYITDKGVHRIWDFSYEVISKRIQDALDLYNEYDSGFQAMKNKSEKEFDFSEMYTFGKFVSFCKRLEKVGRFIDLRLKNLTAAAFILKKRYFISLVAKFKILKTIDIIVL